jgi:hypothetical protein
LFLINALVVGMKKLLRDDKGQFRFFLPYILPYIMTGDRPLINQSGLRRRESAIFRNLITTGCKAAAT